MEKGSCVRESFISRCRRGNYSAADRLLVNRIPRQVQRHKPGYAFFPDWRTYNVQLQNMTNQKDEIKFCTSHRTYSVVASFVVLVFCLYMNGEFRQKWTLQQKKNMFDIKNMPCFIGWHSQYILFGISFLIFFRLLQEKANVRRT